MTDPVEKPNDDLPPPPPPETRPVRWRLNAANWIVGASLDTYLFLQDKLFKWALRPVPVAGKPLEPWQIPVKAVDSPAADAIAARDPSVLPQSDDILQPETRDD